MTGFLVNLLSPVFSSLGVSQADLTSYIEKLIGYVIAIFALLVVMIVVMVVAHKAKKGFRHVIRWQAAIAFIAIVAVLVNVICYGPMYNNVSSVMARAMAAPSARCWTAWPQACRWTRHFLPPAWTSAVPGATACPLPGWRQMPCSCCPAW